MKDELVSDLARLETTLDGLLEDFLNAYSNADMDAAYGKTRVVHFLISLKTLDDRIKNAREIQALVVDCIRTKTVEFPCIGPSHCEAAIDFIGGIRPALLNDTAQGDLSASQQSISWFKLSLKKRILRALELPSLDDIDSNCIRDFFRRMSANYKNELSDARRTLVAVKLDPSGAKATEGKVATAPRKKQPKSDQAKKDLFKAALRTHHGYGEGGSVTNYEPASCRDIEKLTDQRVSDSTARLCFIKYFTTVEKYRQLCFKSEIGLRLLVLSGDAMRAFETLSSGRIDDFGGDDDTDSR